jgi:anti-sigma regulatory factor (Ser/Thr protein kinase)
MLDTHVHTCLSPCGELDMHPAALVEAGVEAGLDAVAVCDHNSAENVAAVQRAGRAKGLAVIPGMEVTSEEEVHVVALLPDTEAALALQSRVQRALPGKNDPDVFGMQVIANEHAEVLGFDEHLLIGATTLGINAVVDGIHAVGGLAVAAHVDREGFGIIGQLGMIPPGLPLDALEVSTRTPMNVARSNYGAANFPLLCGSDAHQPDQVGRGVTFMLMEEPSLSEVRLALAGLGGRAVLGGGRPMEDLLLHILDIVRNAVEAGATAVEIELTEDPARDLLAISVRDNGRGMDEATAARVTDPFFTTRTTRKVGLGLPLLAAAARAAGGDVTVESTPGKGTRVMATFQHSHIDRAPVGDIETTLLVLVAGSPEVEILFRHVVGGRDYELSSRDLAAALEGAGLASPQGLALLRAAIRQGEAELAHGPGSECQ